MPASAHTPRFSCTDPALRGTGRTAMRRLTRDELLQSFAAVVGDDMMTRAPVQRATAQIPLEPPGDLVATFQNAHVFDHVQALLLSAQAIAAETANDAGARARVLGSCAATADRACAQSFLDGTSRRILRRPLDPSRRAALLSAFDAEGGGLAGMQWLLARLLQAPETVFHLEHPRQHCTAVTAAPTDQTSVFDWDDASAFFAPNGAARTGPQSPVDEVGWYVWEIPAARISAPFTELRLQLAVTSADGAPLALDVNLNDTPLRPNMSLGAGDHTIALPVTIAAGASVKLGVYTKTADATHTIALRSLTLGNDQSAAPTQECTDAPAQGGVAPIDDWSVASRLAFGLTGTAPDEQLLAAAASGKLGSLAEVTPHAERLIATPAARRHFETLLSAWLNLDSIPEPHPKLAALAGFDGAGLAAEARRELLDFVVYEVFDRDADVTSLMRGHRGFPRSPRLASLYGSAIATGDTPVDLPRGHGGLLLRIAPLLSSRLTNSPILRGVYVRKRLLCDTLPSPDFSIVNTRLEQFEAEDRTKLTTREAVTEITASGACPSCHVRINPLGFALEEFGPLGQPRTEEIVFDPDANEVARHPIDAQVTGANIEDGAPDALDGAQALNDALAESGKLRACIAERLYTHAQLRPALAADSCGLAEVEAALRAGGSVRSAWLRAIVNDELFVRKAEAMP